MDFLVLLVIWILLLLLDSMDHILFSLLLDPAFLLELLLIV